MSLVRRWKHGGVEYPLSDSTEDTLLEVADPALHHSLLFFRQMIRDYVGDALLARAAEHDLAFPSAVEKLIHYEPSPYLLSTDLDFPIFCLYRSEVAWSEQNKAFDRSESIWEWAYILPPLTHYQIEALHPILQSVAVVMGVFAMQSFDPEFSEGQTLRELTGISKMSAGPASFGRFEKIDNQDKWWRAVGGKLLVQESGDNAEDVFETFTGVNHDLDLATENEETVEAFVEVDTREAPIVESIAPEQGTKTGSQPVAISGKNFVVGTTPYVLIGGAYASSVVVQHATLITCLTPEHAAYPTYAADVVVLNADGQESNVLEAAYTFTSP